MTKTTIYGHIMSTTDYTMFKTYEHNRNLRPSHLRELAADVLDGHDLVPIMINHNYEVIDGHHRLKVAENLGTPILFYICKDDKSRKIKLRRVNLKQNNATHTALDKTKMLAEDGNADAIVLLALHQRYELSISCVHAYLTGSDSARKFLDAKVDIPSMKIDVNVVFRKMKYVFELSKKCSVLKCNYAARDMYSLVLGKKSDSVNQDILRASLLKVSGKDWGKNKTGYVKFKDALAKEYNSKLPEGAAPFPHLA